MTQTQSDNTSLSISGVNLRIGGFKITGKQVGKFSWMN